MKALVAAAKFKTSDYAGDGREPRAGDRLVDAGRTRRRGAPHPTRADQDRRRGPARLVRLRRGRAAGQARAHRGAERAPARPEEHRCDQHPVHQRHHGLAEGRDALPPQHPQQRLLRRSRDRPWRARPALPAGAALSLLRHGDGQPRLRDPWRDHGLPGRGVRAARRAGGGRAGALHRALRRADHVHRRTRPSRVRPLRPLIAAHRLHGRLALPGRGDEAGDRTHAHARRDHRLRHDRDQPGQLPDRRGRPARAPRLDHRPRAAAPRVQDRRRGRRARPARRRRASSARAAIR